MDAPDLGLSLFAMAGSALAALFNFGPEPTPSRLNSSWESYDCVVIGFSSANARWSWCELESSAMSGGSG